MAIEFVGATSGVNSAGLAAGWAVGDLAIVFAYRDGNATPPTLASGWISIVSAAGANTNSGRSASRVLQAGDTTVGTWTNATSVVCLVYRGVAGAISVGASARQSGSSATVTFPAVTLQNASGSSWVARFVGHRSANVAIETAPAGYANRISVSDATDEAAGHDSNGGVTSAAAATAVLGGTASGFESHSIELRFTPVSYGRPVRVWNGTVFVAGVPRRHNGTAWVPATTRTHNGTAWSAA